MVAQLGYDHGLHKHELLRVQLVPGGGSALVDTAMYSDVHTYRRDAMFLLSGIAGKQVCSRSLHVP